MANVLYGWKLGEEAELRTGSRKTQRGRGAASDG